MKFTLSLVACIMAMSSMATVITVSNTANVPAMYNNAQVAVDAASDGDTLQLYPSLNNYGTIILNHGLTLIGAGISATITTKVDYIKCNTVAPVHLIGLVVYGWIGSEPYQVRGQNWVIESCNVSYLGLGNGGWNNVLVKNCIDIKRVDGLGDDSGIIVSNCTFRIPNQYGNEINNEVNGPGAIPVLFENNLFQGLLATSAANHIFQNNVFIGISPDIHTCTGCLFQNNYTTCATCNLATEITGASFLNNIENGPIPFVNYQGMSIDNPNAIQADFHLLPGSAAIGGGTNGSDIGIHAGAYPPSDALAYGLRVLGLPVIDFFAIDNPIIEQNGQLNIQAVTSIPASE
jgi:hypothetical protein